MGILSLIICIISVCISFYTNLPIVVFAYFLVTLLNLWSFLTMVKFRKDLKTLPKIWVLINLITTFFAFSTIIIAIVKSFI